MSKQRLPNSLVAVAGRPVHPSRVTEAVIFAVGTPSQPALTDPCLSMSFRFHFRGTCSNFTKLYLRDKGKQKPPPILLARGQLALTR
jgi:hypothetical protein